MIKRIYIAKRPWQGTHWKSLVARPVRPTELGMEETLGFVFKNLKVANFSFTFAAIKCFMQ